MRKSSVLIRRAAFFTAIMVVITIVVGTSVLHFVKRGQNASAVRDQLLKQAKLLAESASEYGEEDSARLMGKVEMFALSAEGKSGSAAWLTDMNQKAVALTGEEKMPEALNSKTEYAFEGKEKTGTIRMDGRRYGYAMAPVYEDGAVSGVITCVVPSSDPGQALSETLSIMAGGDV